MLKERSHGLLNNIFEKSMFCDQSALIIVFWVCMLKEEPYVLLNNICEKSRFDEQMMISSKNQQKWFFWLKIRTKSGLSLLHFINDRVLALYMIKEGFARTFLNIMFENSIFGDHIHISSSTTNKIIDSFEFWFEESKSARSA